MHATDNRTLVAPEESPDGSAELAHNVGRLARFGLEVGRCRKNEDKLNHVVRGNTYPLNDCLEKAGGRWDQGQEAWLFEGELALQTLIAAIDATETIASDYSLRETASSFQGFTKRDPLIARLLDIGPHVISDEEVLELLIAAEDSLGKPSDMINDLLEQFGSLGAIFAADKENLGKIAYVTDRVVARLKAVQIALERTLHQSIKENPIIGSRDALENFLKVTLRHKNKEYLMVLYLDRKNRLIRSEMPQEGSVHHTPLYPRELAKRSLELAASAIILVHNHPSGDPTPSKTDIEITKKVIQALESIEVTVHDHMIVGRQKFLSFRDYGLI